MNFLLNWDDYDDLSPMFWEEVEGDVTFAYGAPTTFTF